MRMKINKIICTVLLLILMLSIGASAKTYPSYNYLENGGIAVSPQPFRVDDVLFADDFGGESFKKASDIAADEKGNLFVSETEKNRIAVRYTDGSGRIIDSFTVGENIETFKEPQGLFARDGLLYVCDYGNNRLVILNLNDMTARLIKDVKSSILDADFMFLPKRLAVDDYGRMYCVSDGQYNGLMVFEKTGDFAGFVGANKASVTLTDLIWRFLSTDEQKAQQNIFIPTEFSSVAVDRNNFIYTTTSTVDSYTPAESEPIRKQSPNGNNILSFQDKKYPIGDVEFSLNGETYSGPSRFSDITVWDNGIYSALDQTRNRIFTYDTAGNLLFIFGGIGESEGYFSLPVAIECSGGKLYVLDNKTGAVTVLSTTPYAERVVSAVDYTVAGNFESALTAWYSVLDYNNNCELAYLNISQILLNNDDYEAAMKNAKLANNQAAYSEAFTLNRAEIIGENIGYIVVFGALGVLLLIVLVKLGKKYRVIGRLEDRFPTVAALTFSKQIMYAPFDGFWVQKREKKGNVLSGIVIIALLFLSFVYKVEGTGFCFASPEKELTQFNLFLELAKAILPIMLWCLANWCVTTLMGGSGNFRDIFIFSTFSLVPFIFTSFISTFLSNFLTLEEGALLTIVSFVGILYSAFLFIAATCSVHECSFGRAVLTILVTLLGMVIIVFIAILFFNLINKFFDFAISIYNELRLRA